MTVKFTNNASTTVATGINSSATSLTVASASAFPQLAGADDYCYLTIQQSTGTVREVVKATALSSNTFTIVRAQDNTSAGTWSVGDIVELRMTAALLTDVIDAATVEGVKTNFQYTPTAGQTVFSGADNSSNTMIINQAALVSVYMNGVRLVQGTDYNVSSANNTVTLTVGATTADIIDIEVFGNFTGQSGAAVAITGGAISGTSVAATTLSASGTATLNTFVSNNVTISGGTIESTNIGATTAGTGRFSTLTATGNSLVSGNHHVIGSGGSAANSLKASYNSTSGVALFGPDSSGGNTSLNIGTSNSGTFATALTIANTGNATFTGSVGIGVDPATALDISAAGVIRFRRAANDRFGELFHDNNGTTLQCASSGDNLTLTTAGGKLLLEAAGGYSVVVNEGGNDADFRVESDSNTHALFVDAGNSRVGINNSAPNRALDVDAGTASDIATFQNDAGGYTFGYTANLGSWDLGASDALRFRHGATETARFKTTESVFNELGADIDFRVESDGNSHVLFVDGGTNRVTVGGSIQSAVLTVQGGTTSQESMWIYGQASGKGGRIVTIRDTRATGSTEGMAGLRFTSSPGTDYVIGKYYDGASSNFVLADQGGNEFFGIESGSNIVVNQGGSSSRDFRVESVSQSHMFFVDAGANGIGVGTSSVFDHQQGSALDISYDGTVWAGNTYWAGGLRTGVTFYTTTSGDKYKHSNRQAVQHYQNSQGGSHHFYSAAGGTAGNVISWQELAEFDRDEVVFNNGHADQDFRVASNGNTHTLFVDGGNDYVHFFGGALSDAAVGHDFRSNGQATFVCNSTSRGLQLNNISGSGSQNTIAFQYNTAIKGSVVVSPTAVTYNTTSDIRLKDNIVNAPSSSDDIDAIQVRSFDWKADGSHQKYGMVAQELQTVAPEAVYTPDDPDEMMGVDYSKLVPMLIKEIQTLRSRVAELENN